MTGPLIVMLTKGNESPWVRRNAVESLNFQLSILLYAIVSGVLIIAVIGFVLLPIVGLTWLICTIIASVKAARGDEYHDPVGPLTLTAAGRAPRHRRATVPHG